MIDPAGHRVLVKVEEIAEKTEGGLFIPKAVSERETEANIFGTVVAIGKNAWKAYDDGHAWAKVGDRIAFAKYGGFKIRDPETGEDFRIINDEDVTSVIR